MPNLESQKMLEILVMKNLQGLAFKFWWESE